MYSLFTGDLVLMDGRSTLNVGRRMFNNSHRIWRVYKADLHHFNCLLRQRRKLFTGLNFVLLHTFNTRRNRINDLRRSGFHSKNFKIADSRNL